MCVKLNQLFRDHSLLKHSLHPFTYFFCHVSMQNPELKLRILLIWQMQSFTVLIHVLPPTVNHQIEKLRSRLVGSGYRVVNWDRVRSATSERSTSPHVYIGLTRRKPGFDVLCDWWLQNHHFWRPGVQRCRVIYSSSL